MILSGFEFAMNPDADRFGGVGRLFGETGLSSLGQARVCVVGVGGVGSWVVEALARSGVGALTLITTKTLPVTLSLSLSLGLLLSFSLSICPLMPLSHRDISNRSEPMKFSK